MKVNNKENKIESGMEGLHIGDQEPGVMLGQSPDKPRMRRGCRHHHKFGMNEEGVPEGKQHWREMRRQRMAMRQAMMDGDAWGGFPMHGHGPHGMMHPPMMGPPMMYGFPHGPHHGRRHFHQRFSPMMYAGPQSNQFEGDFDPTMGGRPPFHPGMMAMMMMPMFAEMGFHGKKKGDKSDCENKTGSAGDEEPKDQSQRKRKWKKENSSEGMPPFMMAPWMFRGQRFRKCMDKDSCCQKESEDSAEEQTKEKASNDSDFKSRIDAKNGGEKFGPKQQMRIMKRVMAMNGGYPPTMAMYPGAMCPPGVMHRFMQKKRCQHKKKGDKLESDDSPSSGEEIEIIQEDILKDNVAPENVTDSSEAFGMLGACSNVNDGGALENDHDDNENEKDHKKRSGHNHHRRQQMRAMMMNGGFPPMWAMMSHGGFRNHFPNKGRKGKSQETTDAENHKQSGEEKMTS